MKKIIIKTDEQIDGIRLSSKLATASLEYVKEFIVPGISTLELDKLISKFLKENNAKSACLGYKNFPKSCCTSINEEVCHGIPSERRLIEGDIVKIDVATILNGYFGDTCQTFAVGEISQEAEDLIQTTKECLNLGVQEVKPRAFFERIGTVIGDYATERGYSVVEEYGGHGVGIEFHEAPYISHINLNYFNPEKVYRMFPGMIFTVEPMLNIGMQKVLLNETDKWTISTKDKQLSAQFEHTVLVTETGYEILT